MILLKPSQNHIFFQFTIYNSRFRHLINSLFIWVKNFFFGIYYIAVNSYLLLFGTNHNLFWCVSYTLEQAQPLFCHKLNNLQAVLIEKLVPLKKTYISVILLECMYTVIWMGWNNTQWLEVYNLSMKIVIFSFCFRFW